MISPDALVHRAGLTLASGPPDWFPLGAVCLSGQFYVLYQCRRERAEEHHRSVSQVRLKVTFFYFVHGKLKAFGFCRQLGLASYTSAPAPTSDRL